MDNNKKLFSAEFVALNIIVFLNYCNIALFFYFTEYLASISIPPEWFGFLIAVFSLVILFLRPLISPFSNPQNSRKWIVISTIFVMLSLVSYGLADGVVSMTIVRVLHGVAYVVMTVAVTSRVVVSIPREKSTLAFSIISVISLAPYAIVPPGVVWATDLLGSFPGALGLGAILMGLTFPLLLLVPGDPCNIEQMSGSRLSMQEMKRNFSNLFMVMVLMIAVVVWTTYAPVFFFLNNFGDSIGISNPGIFFTISSVAEIGVRLTVGGLMDRGNKPRLLLISVTWLGACYMVMGFVKEAGLFYLMGLLMGLGWGLVMPLISSMVFDVSEPRFRAFNTNITFQMFQMGFFIGPIAGSQVIQHGGFPQLFFAGSFMLILSAFSAYFVFNKGQADPGRNDP